jgi:hypothetical protein
VAVVIVVQALPEEELILEELAAAVQMPQELQLAVEVGLLLEVVRVVEEDLYQHQM